MSETLVTCLTPPGTAAIATIGLYGPAAWEIVRALFCLQSRTGRHLPDEPEVGGVWYGRIGADVADDAVLTVKATRPMPWVEVHCHGGQQSVSLLLDVLAERGARACSWQQFEQVRMGDPLQTLAATALAEAATTRTASILLDQYHGAFRRALMGSLDAIPRLADFAEVGRHLVKPWRVTLAGAPNVGKSSLVNALAGYQRSIVAPTPGTTRDVVTTTIALDGWPLELADTAGLRLDTGALEEQGIERARSAAVSADLCLWVIDASADPVWPDMTPKRLLLVVNKVDLAPAWDLSRASGAVHVSARTGAGLAELCDAIVRQLIPLTLEPDEAVPFTPELCDAIEKAHAHLKAGRIDEARRIVSRNDESALPRRLNS